MISDTSEPKDRNHPEALRIVHQLKSYSPEDQFKIVKCITDEITGDWSDTVMYLERMIIHICENPQSINDQDLISDMESHVKKLRQSYKAVLNKDIVKKIVV